MTTRLSFREPCERSLVSKFQKVRSDEFKPHHSSPFTSSPLRGKSIKWRKDITMKDITYLYAIILIRYH